MDLEFNCKCETVECCYNTNPYLSQEDIDKISQFTGLKLEEFAKEVTDEFKDSPIPVVPTFIFKRKNSEGNPCYFLDQETKLCEIYPLRPYHCRIHRCRRLVYEEWKSLMGLD